MTNSYKTLIGYSIIHGIMDFCSITIILYSINIHHLSTQTALLFTVLYAIFAFGLQPIFGLLLDKFQTTQNAVLIGILLVLGAFALHSIDVFFTVLLAGVGSALFHTAGGSISLNIAPTKSAPPGIFAAPGVAGLILGMTIGISATLILWPFIILLLISSVFVLSSPIPAINYAKVSQVSKISYFKMIIILLLFVLAVRSIYGLKIVFMWRENITLLYTLTMAIVTGKIIGGLTADKFGWIKMSILTLIVATPLIVFFPTTPVLAVIGVFLFSMTMPLPVTALSNMLPGRSAFVFGLTEFFLLFQYLSNNTSFTAPWTSFLIITISMFALLTALTLLYPYFKHNLKINL